MVDMDWKSKMDLSSQNQSPKLSTKVLEVTIPNQFHAPCGSPLSYSDPPACSAYEYYLRLPELRKMWSSKEFPDWETESILKPALQALELTFRLVSVVLSDPRPYTNQTEWKHRLESLATSQIKLIATISEDYDSDGLAPIIGVGSSAGVLTRDGSYTEVWSRDKTTIVSRTSEASLLPRLTTWRKSEDVAQKIMYTIESEFQRCKYTLGLGEPNFAGKPNLQYDTICNPTALYNIRHNPYANKIENHENQVVYTTHQILESWIYTSKQILNRMESRIGKLEFEKASTDCYLIDRIWKLLAEISDLHLIMDPDDFLRLKDQIQIRSESQTDPICFRSRHLVDITRMSKDLRHKVPEILAVTVDSSGGPKIQEAAMKLYREKRNFEKIHLLQGMQAIESSLKKFFYGYKQVMVVVMGSLEAEANRSVVGADSVDSLSQIFLEPTYFPSLDAAKSFLGEFWSGGGEKRTSQGKK